jgi:hypothetical protein
MADDRAKRELEALLPDDFPDLGRFKQVYTPKSGSPFERIATGIIMLAIAPAAVAAAIFITPEKPDDGPVMRGIVGTIAAGLAIGGGVLLALGLKGRGRWFTTGAHWLRYEDGLVVVSDGKPKAYRWADLEVWLKVIVMQVTIATHHEYVLRAAGKKKPIPIPAKLWNLPKVMAALQEQQVKALLPGLLERLRAGETVRFGGVSVTPTGLEAGGESWSWDEVKRFEFQYDLDEAFIVLDVHGRSRPKASVPLSSTTPNLWLFFNVVRKVCGRVVKAAKRPEKYLR